MTLSLFIFVHLLVNPGPRLSHSIPVPLCIIVRSSSLVHTVSLILNNYVYLSDRKEIENDTSNIQGIDRNREKGIRRLDEFWIDEVIEKVG